MSNFKGMVNRAKFQLKKHSPEILISVGVVGTVVSCVMACKATLKVNEIVEESKDTIDKIHTATEKGVTEVGKEYTPEDAKKELTITYVKTGYELAKLYAPAVGLGVFSLGCIIKSNDILRKRNVALAAAYTGLFNDFKGYRSRVIERFGKELDRELKFDIKAKEIEETVIDENGNEVVTKKTVNVGDPTAYSQYAKFFDCGCAGWTKDPESNLVFLKQQERYANDKLKADKFLFLNDVLGMLGIPKTPAGQRVGWIYDEEHPNGDNFVDFGIFNIYNEKARDFVNGYENVILLDFNVDGEIWDLIGGLGLDMFGSGNKYKDQYDYIR